MAEPTQTPALPSTADTTPYVPVSWTAAAAALLAGMFLATLLFFGGYAFKERKPLLEPALLIIPLLTLVLCFAARRIIDNSEGTRTGTLYGANLVNTAWWASVVLGLGYVAYLFAIDYSVRRDAAGEVERWVAIVREDNQVELAFYKTLPPGQRQAVKSNDTFEIKRRFGDELLAFSTCDLMKLAQRNRGELVFTPTGVMDWSYKPGTIDCTFSGTVTCPEGKFPVVVPLKGVEGVAAGDTSGGGGRQWMIVRPPNGGFILQDKIERTTYGWFVLMLELTGGGFGKSFLDHVAFGPTGYPYLYRAYLGAGAEPSWVGVVRNPLGHVFFAIPAGLLPGGTGGRPPENFFKLPGGGEPSSGQKERFFAGWHGQGAFEAGRRLKDAGGNVPDKESTLKITDTAVELYVPIELPLATTGKIETARGRLVVACTDPALLAELKQHKDAAKTEKPYSTPPEELGKRAPIAWRIVRIESDLTPATAHQGPERPGPRGMPGG